MACLPCRSGSTVSGERRGLLKTATAHYKALLASSMVAFESNLRFGFMQHVQGDGPLARQHLREARQLSRDPFIQYVGAFLEGALAGERRSRQRGRGRISCGAVVAPRAGSASTGSPPCCSSTAAALTGFRCSTAHSSPIRPADDPWLRYGMGEGLGCGSDTARAPAGGARNENPRRRRARRTARRRSRR